MRMIKAGDWIGFDFDGTIAEYYEPFVAGKSGNPIKRAVDALKGCLDAGISVRIVTARAAGPVGPNGVPTLNMQAVKDIGDWCEKHIGVRLPVTFWKDCQMAELYDDRAIQMIPNEGLPFTVVAGRVCEQAEQLYLFAMDHNGFCPPKAWEALRIKLQIPRREQRLVVPASELKK